MYSFLVLAGIYTASIILITLVGNQAPNKQTDSSVTAAKAASGPTAVIPTTNTSAVAAHAPRVIGNSDSKRYHLPGMRYYHRVETRHRVEFSSEDEAIKAGYHKAAR